MKRIFLMMIAMLITALPFILLYLYEPVFFHSITEDVNQHLMVFRAIRWGIILFFILTWPYLVHKLGKHFNAPAEHIVRWQAERYRIAIWLIIFELLICENVISKLVGIIT